MHAVCDAHERGADVLSASGARLAAELAPGLLETLPQRLAEFEALGIDAALVLKFDEELAKASAEEFAQRYLG